VKLIHTCYRITDPERSLAFYEALGFEKRRELPIRDEAVNYFLGIPGHEQPELELTHNFGVGSYELGTAYGHIAVTGRRHGGGAVGPGREGHRAREAAV
jgi:lactoylglutathione lyase